MVVRWHDLDEEYEDACLKRVYKWWSGVCLGEHQATGGSGPRKDDTVGLILGEDASGGDTGKKRDGSGTNGRTRVRKPPGASQGRHQKSLNSGGNPGEEGWGPTGKPLRKETSQGPF